jgi:hypothetical protein
MPIAPSADITLHRSGIAHNFSTAVPEETAELFIIKQK